MLWETVVKTLLVNILLAVTAVMAKRDIDLRPKPGGVFCKANPMSDPATLASMPEEAELAGKEQLLDQLLEKLVVARQLVMEKRSLLDAIKGGRRFLTGIAKMPRKPTAPPQKSESGSKVFPDPSHIFLALSSMFCLQ